MIKGCAFFLYEYKNIRNCYRFFLVNSIIKTGVDAMLIGVVGKVEGNVRRVKEVVVKKVLYILLLVAATDNKLVKAVS